MKDVHFWFGSSKEGGAFHCRTVPVFPFERDGFSIDDNAKAADGWLVVTDPDPTRFQTRIPRERRIFVEGEPSPMSKLSAGFVNQFGILISSYRVNGYTGFYFQSHPAIPWFFSARCVHPNMMPILSYDQLVRLPIPPKQNAVSAIVSGKAFHDGHRKRLRFLELLQPRLGDKLHIYGRGIRHIDDKAEAILPYAYHLAMENTVEPSYWTEKLADAYLGYALPIYVGAPDIDRWFAPSSMLRINLDEPERACDEVVAALEGNLYQERLPEILEARRRVLEEETVFDVVLRAIRACPCGAEAKASAEWILPPRHSAVSRLHRKLRKAYHKLTFRTSLRRSQNAY